MVDLSERRISYPKLTALFVIAFLIPLFLARNFSDVFSPPIREDINPKDKIFPAATKITKSGQYFEITNHESLDPSSEKDFLFVFWYRLAGPLEPGEVVPIVSKVDERSKFKRGFAVSIKGEDTAKARILVYWRDSEGNGNWYSFSEMQLKPRVWSMIAVSFYNQRVLGAHRIERTFADEVSKIVLGGFDIEEHVLPRSSSSLAIGAISPGGFRGWLGPFGIFQVRDLERDLSGILDEFGKEPRQIPSRFADANVMLWAPNGAQDLSPKKHEVLLRGVR